MNTPKTEPQVKAAQNAMEWSRLVTEAFGGINTDHGHKSGDELTRYCASLSSDAFVRLRREVLIGASILAEMSTDRR